MKLTAQDRDTLCAIVMIVLLSLCVWACYRYFPGLFPDFFTPNELIPAEFYEN